MIYDLGREKAIASLKAMDLHQCKAIYKIKGNYTDIKVILDNSGDFEKRQRHPEEEEISGAQYYSWLRRGQSKAIEKDMRPKLIELMKQHLKGIERQNKDRGLDLNIDWVLDELLLLELK